MFTLAPFRRVLISSVRALCLFTLTFVVPVGVSAAVERCRPAVPEVALRDSVGGKRVPLRQTDVWPSFPGGREVMDDYVDSCFAAAGLPEASVTRYAVKVRFIVEKDGTVARARIVEGVSDSIDNAVLAVLAKMPKWTPGQKDGQVVRTGYGTTLGVPVAKEHVRTLPEFPGGEDVLLKYVYSKLRRAGAAKYKGPRVKIVACFVVRADGRVSDVEILRHGRAVLDDAVLSALRGMPKWTPGTVDGKPVNVRYVLPFTFGKNK